MNGWDAWIGREESRSDRVDSGAVGRWLATLDRDAPLGGLVPQGYHWCLCLPDAPSARLGADGHPARDESLESFLPPVPMPRRMWAASQVEFHEPLRIGEAVTRTSRVLSIKEKSGASGQLVFVEVEHETNGESHLAVREIQSIVYRDAAPKDTPLAPPPPSASAFDPSSWQVHRAIEPSSPLLFRFSAITFNAHRIHYDLPYARDIERYRGLVVHGPLTASLLLDLARRQMGDEALATFSFRGLSPAIGGEVLHLAMRGPDSDIELAAFASDGRQVMAAKATRKS